MIDKPPQPWSPAQATEQIWKIAKGNLDLIMTKHASDQLAARRLITGDVMYVLKNGYVYENPEPSTREGLYKYRVESSTPNSNSRTLRLVVVPCATEMGLKIVTVMWRDEETSFGNSR